MDAYPVPCGGADDLVLVEREAVGWLCVTYRTRVELMVILIHKISTSKLIRDFIYFYFQKKCNGEFKPPTNVPKTYSI